MPAADLSLSRPQQVGRDLVAGVVVFLVALPLCLGIALASGAPLLSGLISGVIGGLLVGFLSGSHVSVSGPAAGLAAIVLAQIASLGSFEAFLLAVLIAGGLQVVFGALKGGFLANYFPTNVIKGLLAAIGVLLILKQVPHLVGYDADFEGDMAFSRPDGSNTFTDLMAAASAILPGALTVGLASVAVLLVWDRTPLKKSIVPGPLVAVVMGTVLSVMMRGTAWEISASHLVEVPVMGGPDFAWSDVITMPDFGRIADPAIYLAAATLAIVASLETLLNIEATDRLDPQRRWTPQNRELLAQGIGNMASGLVGGLPMTSVIVRSSVNVNAGSRTKLSAIFHGVLLLGSVALLPGVLNMIPLSALAAVLVVTGFKLASPTLVRSMWAEGKAQFIPFAVTILAIVFTDLLVGVLIGLGTSLAFIMWGNINRGFRVVREEHVGGIVHRIELSNQATFLNRAKLNLTLGEFRPGDRVLIDARTCDYIDNDILTTIHEYARETAPGRGVHLSLLGFQERYPLKDEVQYVDVSTREVQASLTPSKVLQLLKEGNERFVSGHRLKRDLARQVDATAQGQHPMAAVLSCIDSRAPAELLFDLGIGDMFSVRLAGNVASPKALGSLEFACKVAGSKLIVVLGHTRCGAVKATCDFVAKGLDPVEATGLTNLGSITEPIAEAVRMETRTIEGRDASNEAFVNRVAAINVRNTIRWIQDNSPTLSSMLMNGEIAIVGAMYDVTTGRVEFLDGAGFALDAEQPTAASAQTR
jgi:MFS superfamily sulfate permease-like transporter